MDNRNPSSERPGHAESAANQGRVAANGRSRSTGDEDSDQQTSGRGDSDRRLASTQDGALPALSLPKGGGAIRGIGEKFAANPVDGSGKLTIPLRLSQSRSNFTPDLSLAYNSSSGNNAFGFGWSLSLPQVTRKTDKGLPQYQDAQESDIFILSGAEDLMPGLVQSGSEWIRDVTASRTVYGLNYEIHRYRPRVDNLFSRIERWVNLADATDTFWRSITKDNVTTWYGQTAASRIADPADATRVFTWLISLSYDDKGNAVSYEYKPEDSEGANLAEVCERNRTPQSRSANRYIKRVHYGNRAPYLPDLTAEQAAPLPSDWCFQLVFDYGEHDLTTPTPQETAPWICRLDPFSSYRSRFEIRTYRLCRRALMFHSFTEDPNVGVDCLVNSTDLTHVTMPPADPSQPFYSYLLSATQSSYARTGASSYYSDSMPPVEFTYTQAVIDETVREISTESLRNLPGGIDETNYRWVDLNGEGLSGILTEQAGAWFYKANLSPINRQTISGKRYTLPLFAEVRQVGRLPSTAALNAGRQRLYSISGDGQMDLVDFSGTAPGYFERTENDDWTPMVPFESLPVVDWSNPELKFMDLTGDGFPDLLISEGNDFSWYQSLSTLGFAGAERIPQAYDEEQGPKLVFADTTETIFLADLSGDGLTDLVRIRNGAVCYWPNVGYGQFGAKVTMDNSPLFDHPDLFDARNIQLADIDGSGTADIVYFASNTVKVYLNQSGNGWGAERALNYFPGVDSVSKATVMDLLGNGTACLVWSSPLPGNASSAMRYIDLMGGRKPHLLVSETNNMGAMTQICWAPSTKFYIADKLAGTPWVTRVPFPVQVVERIERFDYVSRNLFVTSYTYHDGYYDGVEREFRGFGRVDSYDTEESATLMNSTAMPEPINVSTASDVPPILTKTWYHTGAYFGETCVSRYMQEEYYSEGDAKEGIPGLTEAQKEAMLLDDTVLPTDILLANGTRVAYSFSPEEYREACRALRGMMLRQEVYGLDGTAAEDRPYTVSESNFTIEAFQPQGPNRYGVFFAHPRETVDFQYERMLYKVVGSTLAGIPPPPSATNAADPRVSHTLTTGVNPFGNVLESAKVSYGRRYLDPNLSAADQATQGTTLSTYEENEYTNAVDSDDVHRTPLLTQSCSYQLLQAQPASNVQGVTNLFAFDEMQTTLAGLDGGLYDIPYEDLTPTGLTPGQAYRRQIAEKRVYYRPDDMGAAAANARALLPLGQLESLALPGCTYQLAFTPGLLTQVFERNGTALLPTPAAVLASTAADGGAYVDLDSNGQWWIPSGRIYYLASGPATPQELTYAEQNFFLPCRLEDPFGNASTVSYDGANLLPVQTTDAANNVITAQNDYRVLAPAVITDANGNQTAASYNVFGLVTATAVMGKMGQNLGDTLTGFTADLTQAQIDAYYDAADPHTLAPPLLGNATTRIIYDIHGFYNSTLTAPNDPTQWQPCFTSTIARETHVSSLSEGQQSALQINFSYSDGFVRVIQQKLPAEPGPVTEGGPVVSPRWVGSGWTIYNNKGKPVRQYEPFFSQLPTSGHQFEFGVAIGVSPIICYDPPGRAVATIHPNQSFEKSVYDPWNQQAWDVNDTVMITNPATDADVGGMIERLPAADYLPTWYTQRAAGGMGPLEQAAANQAATCANTPTITYFDPLGRTFLTVADNGSSGKYLTHVDLDIQGNQRSITDPLNREAVVYDYTIPGERIHISSMEAGARWMLNDTAGKTIRSWDSRGHNARYTYDTLRRPLGRYVLGTDATNSDPRTLTGEVLYETTTYGEGQANDQALNLRTHVYQMNDIGGVAMNMVTDPATQQQVAYDFKGNLLGSSRQFVADQTALTNWANPAPPFETDVFLSFTQYDALNRVIASTAPDGSVVNPVYNEANLLESIGATLAGQASTTDYLTNINYNAKGQRIAIVYGNGVTKNYNYDPLTFRLTNLTTVRNTFPVNQQTVQDLSYTYDAIGNITHIEDDADIQNAVFFRNQRVDPSADYTYDPIYRLITATGREQLGLNGSTPLAPTSYNDTPRTGLLSPSDGNAMGTYNEQYQYDNVGNLMALIHKGSDPANPGWSRSYTYNEPSLLDAAQMSNRLSSTAISGNMPLNEPYSYDLHGNMASMPQLKAMNWDFKDQLLMTQRQAVNASDQDGLAYQGAQTWYAYSQSGVRVRKTNDSAASVRTNERLYLGGYEVYREFDPSGNITLERHSLHVMDGRNRIVLVETLAVDTSMAPTLLPSVTTRYQYDNHLGTACLELDEYGSVITYEEYYPFGSTSYQAGATAAEVSLKRYRYTAKERDSETGLYYHGARYYACWLGRWTACDPIGIEDGPNLYVYCSNNPVCRFDKDGTQDDTAPETPSVLPPIPEFKLKDPTAQDDNKPQMNMPNLGLTNPAWQAQNNPVGTYTTEFTGLLPFQSETTPGQGLTLSPSLLTSIRYRTSTETEVGAYFSFGGQIPLRLPGTSTGNGSLGASFHYGPEPPDNGFASGFGLWLTLGQVWGLEPQVSLPPPGWSFNPTLNTLAAYSFQQANKWDFDVVAGFNISRWGQVNGVSVAAPLTPFGGANLAVNITDHDVINFEGVAGSNLGLGGRADNVPGPSVPSSFYWAAGIGYQLTRGDYGFGIELYGFGEQLSNVTNQGTVNGVQENAAPYNWGGGLRLDFGAINPLRGPWPPLQPLH